MVIKMEDKLTIKLIQLLENVECEVLYGSIDNLEIDYVISNTKNIKPNSIFICIKGNNFDPNNEKVIVDIINNGCTSVVCEKDIDLDYVLNNVNKKNFVIVKTNSSKKALAIISNNYYKKSQNDLTIIGITGTKGKTTTSFMIQRILLASGIKTGIIGTMGCYYNNEHIKTDHTTPDSLTLNKFFYLMKNSGITHVVMETSSQSFKLDRVYGIHFDYAIFTNFSEDHIGKNEHDNIEEYFNCKLKIFDNCDKAIVNADDDKFNEIKDYCNNKKIELSTFSTKDIHKELIKTNDVIGVKFTTELLNNKQIILNMPGMHNIYNAICSIKLAKMLNINDDIIVDVLKDFKVDGRVEVVHNSNEMTIIVDYAHNELGTLSLITAMKEYNPDRIVVVFGCGGNRDKNRRYGMGDVIGKYADFSIVTADNSRFEKTEDIINDILSTLTKRTQNYVVIIDRREAIEYAIKNHKTGDLILVIGKGHEDYNDMNGKKEHFSDKEEILKILNE